MSKSKGNVLDPLDMIDGISLSDLLEKRTGNMMQPQLAEKIAKRTEKQFPDGIEAHGTDALRFTLAALASTGRDINWDMKRLDGYRNFCNKLWNASRYVLMNTQEHDCSPAAAGDYSLADRWIQSQLQLTIRDVRQAMDSYRFDQVAAALYEFIWNQFCDWYLELTKPVLWNGTPAQQQATRHTLVTVLETLLRLVHPLMPFISEEIWQNVAPLADVGFQAGDTLMLQAYPAFDAARVDEAVLADQEWVKQFIVSIRNIRAEMNVAPSVPLTVLLKADAVDAARAAANAATLKSLAKLESISVLADGEAAPVAVTKLIGATELLIPMAGLIDKAAELARLDKEIAKLTQECGRIEGKLGNDAFVAKAPEAVIAKEREKLGDYQLQLTKLKEQQETIRAL